MRIVGIDPGQTTGYVDVRVDADGSVRVVDAQEIVWTDRFQLKPLLAGDLSNESLPPNLVIIEQFTLYEHRAKEQIGSHFPSVRVIGLVEAYLHGMGLDSTLIFQPASVRSRVKVLPEHEGILSKSPHTHDAYQHVRYYIITQLRH